MEITKENVLEAISAFKKMYSGTRSFTEAYNRGEPYYYQRHKILIVPSELINVHFGCNRYRMSAKLVEILQEVGGRRAYRQIYENGKQSFAILTWVFDV